jgi:cbb3-type cytochrome oxidase subunit 3
MFISNPKFPNFELSSNYSDYISFDAPNQRPMEQPVIETLMYNPTSKYIKLVPESSDSIDRTCDQTSFVQIKVRKRFEETNWTGCIKITSETLENQEQLVLHHMSYGNLKNVTMDKIFVYKEFKDCNSFEFSVRIGSPKPNSKIEVFNPDFCPEFDSENEKMSEWTEWDSIAVVKSKTDLNYQKVCKKPEPIIPAPEMPDAEPEVEPEIECLFPNANICLKIEHLIIIIGCLVLILVFTCVTFICFYKKNRNSNSNRQNYSRSDYLQMNKKNNSGLYGGQNCSRGEEAGLIGMDIQHSLPTFQQNHINNRTGTYEPDSPPRRSTSSEFIKPRPLLPRLHFGTNPTLSEPTPQQQNIFQQRNKENVNQSLPIDTQLKFSFNSNSSPPLLPVKTTNTPKRIKQNEIDENDDSDSFPSSTISLGSDISPPAKHRNIKNNTNIILKT